MALHDCEYLEMSANVCKCPEMAGNCDDNVDYNVDDADDDDDGDEESNGMAF